MDETSQATAPEANAPKRPRTRRTKVATLLDDPTPLPEGNSAPTTGESTPNSVEAQPAPKSRPRGRSRKQLTEETLATPVSDELFPAHSVAAIDTPKAEPAVFVYSAAPDDQPPAEDRPIFSPSSRSDRPAPIDDASTAEVAPFLDHAPAETADNEAASTDTTAPSTSDETPNAIGTTSQDAASAARRDDRKSWWERKKEKKRQKWLERQQGGPSPKPAHSAADYRERPPQQPAPPVLARQTGSLPNDERFSDHAALDAIADQLAADPNPVDLNIVHAESIAALADRLRDFGETVAGQPPRRPLIEQLFTWARRENRCLSETGVLDLTDSGHGFITHLVNSYRVYPDSTYVPASLVRRHGLRRGQAVSLLAQPPQNGERCPSAVRILSVMGVPPEEARNVTAFEELTPYYPTARILVEAPTIHKDISMRAVDLLTPIGFGQRGLIVAPPRTGKTVLLQNIANSISHNFPETTLLLLLIDERPEEVTDFRRHTRGEVVASTFDEGPESHVHAAEMVIERARRLVETGHHVVILLDSITRLARAYNALAGNGGKTMSGGIESNALQRPKRFFGSARNIEGGGSLTILATALIDTNSRMDEVIFEEFKGTGNMELHLDRGLSDKRIFPAINIDRSGTRKEELIYHPDEMLRVYGLRRAMQGIPPVEAMDMFIQRLKKTRTNAEFLLSLNR